MRWVRVALSARGSFVVALVWLGLSALMAQDDLELPVESFLPHIGDGVFDGGQLRTTFVLSATGIKPVQVESSLTGDTGEPLEVDLFEGETDLGLGSSFRLLVAPGGTRFLTTGVTAEGFGSGAAGCLRDRFRA